MPQPTPSPFCGSGGRYGVVAVLVLLLAFGRCAADPSSSSPPPTSSPASQLEIGRLVAGNEDHQQTHSSIDNKVSQLRAFKGQSASILCPSLGGILHMGSLVRHHETSHHHHNHHHHLITATTTHKPLVSEPGFDWWEGAITALTFYNGTTHTFPAQHLINKRTANGTEQLSSIKQVHVLANTHTGCIVSGDVSLHNQVYTIVNTKNKNNTNNGVDDVQPVAHRAVDLTLVASPLCKYNVVLKPALHLRPSSGTQRSSPNDFNTRRKQALATMPADHKRTSALQQRQRRSQQPTSAHTVCRVWLDADSSYAALWGGKGTPEQRRARVIAKMIDTFHLANNVIQNNNKNNHNKGNNTIIIFRVAGVAVHDDLQFPFATPQQLLQQYQQWLTSQQDRQDESGAATTQPPTTIKTTSLAPQDVCLNHLFTHSQLNTGALGMTQQASPSPDTIGGICESRLLDGGVANTAMSTSLTATNEVVQTWQGILAITHQLGHSLGASHPCELSDNNDGTCTPTQPLQDPSCTPSQSSGGPFIMHPLILRNSWLENRNQFSSCSIGEITTVVASKGGCLQLESACNNGSNDNTCCMDNGFIAPQGTSCGHPATSSTTSPMSPMSTTSITTDPQCVIENACDGVSAQCPSTSRFVADYTPCEIVTSATNDGYCMNGTCVHIHDSLCAVYGMVGCSFPDVECAVGCADRRGSQCFPYSASCADVIASTHPTIPDSRAPVSSTLDACPIATSAACTTLPSGQPGTCVANGTCIGAPSVLVRDQCEVVVVATSSCSQPCLADNSESLPNTKTELLECLCTIHGDALVMPIEVCVVSTSPADTHVDVTENAFHRTSRRVECGGDIVPQSCDASDIEYTDLLISPALQQDSLTALLQEVSGLPLEVTAVTVDVDRNVTQSAVYACRGDHRQCLSSDQIYSILTHTTVTSALQSEGFTIRARSGSGSSTNKALVAIAVVLCVIAGILVIVAIYLYKTDDEMQVFFLDDDLSAFHLQAEDGAGDGESFLALNNQYAQQHLQLSGLTGNEMIRLDDLTVTNGTTNNDHFNNYDYKVKRPRGTGKRTGEHRRVGHTRRDRPNSDEAHLLGSDHQYDPRHSPDHDLEKQQQQQQQQQQKQQPQQPNKKYRHRRKRHHSKGDAPATQQHQQPSNPSTSSGGIHHKNNGIGSQTRIDFWSNIEHNTHNRNNSSSGNNDIDYDGQKPTGQDNSIASILAKIDNNDGKDDDDDDEVLDDEDDGLEFEDEMLQFRDRVRLERRVSGLGTHDIAPVPQQQQLRDLHAPSDRTTSNGTYPTSTTLANHLLSDTQVSLLPRTVRTPSVSDRTSLSRRSSAV